VNEDQVRLNFESDGLEVPREVRVVPDDSEGLPLGIVAAEGNAWGLVGPEMGAHLRSMHRISLRPEGFTIPLRHPMEAVYYVIAGAVEIHDLDSDVRHQTATGGMVLVDPGTRYQLIAGSAGSEIVGGPCPADPRLYAAPGGG
jgi:hypothetical protein